MSHWSTPSSPVSRSARRRGWWAEAELYTWSAATSRDESGEPVSDVDQGRAHLSPGGQHGAVYEGRPPCPALPECGLVPSQREVVPSVQCLPAIVSREDDQRVFVLTSRLQSRGDVSDGLVHGRDHGTVGPPGGVADVEVVTLVLHRNLQWGVNTLECEIEEHRPALLSGLLDQVDGLLGQEVGAVPPGRRPVHRLPLPPVVPGRPGLGAGHPGVLVVVLAPRPVAGVGVEPSLRGKVGLTTEAQVPLAQHMSIVAQPPEVLRHESEVGEESGGFLGPEDSGLPASVYGVPPGHEGGPGGGADRLDVALLQDHPGTGQPLQVRSEYVLVVPGYIIEAQVIRHYQDYVGLVPSPRSLKNDSYSWRSDHCIM